MNRLWDCISLFRSLQSQYDIWFHWRSDLTLQPNESSRVTPAPQKWILRISHPQPIEYRLNVACFHWRSTDGIMNLNHRNPNFNNVENVQRENISQSATRCCLKHLNNVWHFRSSQTYDLDKCLNSNLCYCLNFVNAWHKLRRCFQKNFTRST